MNKLFKNLLSFFSVPKTPQPKKPNQIVIDVLTGKDRTQETADRLLGWVDVAITDKHHRPFNSLKDCLVAMYALSTRKFGNEFDERRFLNLFGNKLSDVDDLQMVYDGLANDIFHAGCAITEKHTESASKIFETQARDVLKNVLRQIYEDLQRLGDHSKLDEIKEDAYESAENSSFKKVTLEFFETAKAV